MGIRRARDAVSKTRAESKITAVDYAPFLGALETIASVGTVTISPTGGSPLGGAHISSAGTAIVGTTVEVVLQGGSVPQAATADASTDELTFSSAHGWPDDTPVQMIGRCLPRGKFQDDASNTTIDDFFDASASYYVRAGSGTASMTLAECPGGPAIDITQAETATLTLGINYEVIVPITSSASPAQVIAGEFVCKVRQ